MTSKSPLTYRDAGVDIDAGAELIEHIKPAAARTRRPGVLTGLGGFGALFELPVERYRQPVLVSGTDGVGTKLKLALESGRHDGIGIDLVAMCVNDVVVQGAEPLFFLDYYATGHLHLDTAAAVVESIAKGCELAGAALIGGETAELPGMYRNGDYDLAGFCVGVAEKACLIDGSSVVPGDAVIGLASSGPHANGYSMIRKVLERDAVGLDSEKTKTLLAPTRIYVKPLLELMRHVPVHALAHITGGGLIDNIPRVLPAGMSVRLSPAGWQVPPVFDWLKKTGEISDREMYRTFNMGIGMAIIVPSAQRADALDLLTAAGETAWRIGEVEAGTDSVVIGAPSRSGE